MQEYNQGDTYEEYTDENGLPLEEAEGIEDTEAKITKLWGIPIKFVVLGGVGVFVIILLLLLFSLRDKPEESSPIDNFQSIDTTVTPVQPVDTSDMVWDYATGQYVPADQVTQITTPAEVDLSSLSTEDQLTLRKLGYTGDEIATALEAGFDVQGLIDHAIELHDAEADEALRRMSDSASEEFRWIIEYSYFGQPGYEFISHADDYFGSYAYEHNSYVVNADYVKCPTYGSQLQLKCKVAEDLEVFYVVTPERFDSLPDNGNIVLEVSYTLYGENTYVTDIKEAEGTYDTIDSTDVTTQELKNSAESEAASITEP